MLDRINGINRMVGVRRQYRVSSVECRVSAALCIACALVLILAPSLHAGPVYGFTETWDADQAGWLNDAPDVPTDGFGTIGHNPAAPAYLELSFADQSPGPAMYEEDTMYTTGTNYTGSYQLSGLAVSFKFYADDLLPDPGGSVLYVHSAVDGSLWRYAFANSAIDTWTEHTISFSYSSDWAGPGGATEFYDALANVDWIGVNVARAMNTAPQSFGLDDWQFFYIPEPGALVMLSAAFLSMAMPFRKKLRFVLRE